MNFTKNTIALISIWTVSVAALILSIIGVAHSGHGCRWERFPMMGNGNMMQQDFQGRGNMMRQRFDANGTGNTPVPPTQQAPAETPAQ